MLNRRITGLPSGLGEQCRQKIAWSIEHQEGKTEEKV
jgi:hypothetical protein